MVSRIIAGPPVAVVTSDASGHWGCGAFTSRGGLVSVPVVQVLGACTHHGEGAPSCGDDWCPVGDGLAWASGALPL